MGRVFISYSHNDSEKVRYVNKFLNEHNILTWFDVNDIKASDHWDKHIKTAIYASDVFLVFYSKSYNLSSYCRKEFEIAKNKDNGVSIIIVGLDEACDSFDINEDISSIQRVNYNYKKNTLDDLNNELLNNSNILNCSIIDNNEINGEEISFLHGISEIENPRHYLFLKLFIKFLIYIKAQEKENKYISSTCNFSSLVLIKSKDLEYEIKLIGTNDFVDVKDENIRNIFLKNVLYCLFNYGFREYSFTLPIDIIFNEIFLKYDNSFNNKINVEIYDIFNSLIQEVYHNFNDINEIIKKLSIIYNASLYYENIESYYKTGRSLYNYEVNSLVIEISKKIYISQNELTYNTNIKSYPDIISEGNEEIKNDEKDALSKLIERTGKDDIFLYGEVGLGKTSLIINYFVNNLFSVYLDLNKVGSKFDNNIIRNSLLNMDDKCYKFDFNSLYNYSTYENTIVILLDNFDYLPRNKKRLILEELTYFEDAFKIILLSSKRNIEEKISLDVKDSLIKNYKYYEIKSLDKDKIISYLSYLGIKETIKYDLEIMDEEDNFFKFFNNFTKLNVLYDSIKDLDNFSIKELKDQINSEIKIYQMIFESTSDFSVSKRMSLFFKDSIVPIDDIIIELMLDEINKLKEISYSKSFEKINKLRFRDFDCVYSILCKQDNDYRFLNNDIKSYFVASYIYSKIKENPNDFSAISNLLSPLNNDYSVLKYINEFEVLDLLDLNILFNEENKDKYMDLKYILFKISQYNKDTRKIYSLKSNIEVIPDGFFFGAENISVVTIPKSVKEIGRAAFTNMTKLNKLVLLSDSEELAIKPWTIINCPSLEVIKIGKNYKKYHHPLISQCKGMKEIIVNSQNEYFTTLQDNKMLVSKDKTHLYLSLNSLNGDIIIDDGIKILEDNAFSYLDNITSIYIPSSIESIETNFSDFCSNLVRFNVDKNNKYYYSDENGYIYTNKDNKKVLFRVPSGITYDLMIPSDVKVIGSDSISCCGKVKKIYVPNSVEYIENYAFADTVSLNYLEFENIENIKKIENYIFLTTNKYLRIGIKDEEDDYIYLNVDKFNKVYNSETVNEFSINIKESIIDVDLFRNEGFEIISNHKNEKKYSKIVILRAINIFENLFEYNADNFNILMIGMTEFNAINAKGSLEMERYIEELLTSRHISLIVFTRDLPMIDKLNKYTNQVSIIRTSSGSTSATRKLINLLNKKVV